MLPLTKKMAEHEGVTEQLKAQDQVLWVHRMNGIKRDSEQQSDPGRRLQQHGIPAIFL